MKATYLHAAHLKAFGAIALSFGIGACVPSVSQPSASAPVSNPATAPVARPAPTPVPPPEPIAPEPYFENYLDAPHTMGTWRYQQGNASPIAVFVTPDGTGVFALSCDRSRGAIDIWRAGTSVVARAMRIRTETTERTLRVTQAEDTNPYLTTSLPANDRLLDAMAITKGRIAIEVEAQRTLYIPAWVEIGRVIEDCR